MGHHLGHIGHLRHQPGGHEGPHLDFAQTCGVNAVQGVARDRAQVPVLRMRVEVHPCAGGDG